MFVVVIWITDWLSGLIVLVTLPVVVTFLVLIGRPPSGTAGRQWRSLERLSHHFLDVVDGLTTLRVFGRAGAQQRSIAAVTDDYRRTTMGVLRVSFLSSFVLELAASLSVALVAVQIGLRLLGGDLALGAGLLILLLAPDVYLPLRQLGAAHHAAEEGRAATAGVLDVLDLPEPAIDRAPGAAGGPPRAGGPRRGGPPARPGRPSAGVARAGPRRAGRAHRARAGPASRRCWPCCSASSGPTPGRSGWAAWTSPTPTPSGGGPRSPGSRNRAALLPGSVADNVALGAADASDAEVRRAMALAAAEDIDPRRVLGEDGAGLSAGERQRIALARAFLRAERGAGLLLLDEPTAHLDGPTQERVLAGLRRVGAGRCVLLVVHDRALAAAADRIVRMPTAGPTPAPDRPGVAVAARSWRAAAAVTPRRATLGRHRAPAARPRRPRPCPLRPPRGRSACWPCSAWSR